MSESDVETLFEEPLAPTQTLVQQQPATKPSLGKRALIWKRKFLERLKYRFTIASLKAQGCTKEEILDELPEYYYDEEYHGLTEEPWFRRNKSTADLRSCVGSNTGYSGWEFVGPDRPELWNGIEQAPSVRRLSLDECKIS
jgi:hypothetical protein